MSEMELAGALEPPMANGEVIFEEPWQSRVFGLARILCEQGHYSWDDFRARLIENIERWESKAAAEDAFEYFDCFLEALSQLLDEKGLCLDADQNARTEAFAARPHGHDH